MQVMLELKSLFMSISSFSANTVQITLQVNNNIPVPDHRATWQDRVLANYGQLELQPITNQNKHRFRQKGSAS